MSASNQTEKADDNRFCWQHVAHIRPRKKFCLERLAIKAGAACRMVAADNLYSVALCRNVASFHNL
jgi:hypothetical protein